MKRSVRDEAVTLINRYAPNMGVCGSVAQLCLTLCGSMDCSPPGITICPQNLPGKILDRMPFPPPGIFLTLRLNPHLLQWQTDSLPVVPPRKPHAPKIATPTYIKRILTDLKGEIDRNTIIVEGYISH